MENKPDVESLDGSESSEGSEHRAKSTVSGEKSNGGFVTKRENRAVLRSKILVLSVIAATALAFGAAVYVHMRGQERYEFEKQFHDLALEVVDLTKRELESAFDVTAHLATSLTLHAMDSASVWPFVVLPHIEMQGKSLSQLCRIEQFNIVPLVHRDTVVQWQNFASQNQGWIQEGLNERLGDESTTTQAGNVSSHVYRTDNGTSPVPQTGLGLNGYYAPLWQQYPTPLEPSVINFDLFSNTAFEQSFEALSKSNSTIISDFVDLDFMFPDSRQIKKTVQRSFLMQPVFADFSTKSDDSVVGLIIAVVGWDTILQHMARSNEKVTMVLQNSCGNSLSYETDGSDSTFVGAGDFHQTKFDYLEVSETISVGMKQDTMNQTSELCAYELKVYPTDDFRDHYLSASPLIYSGIAVFLFFFLVVVFYFYDTRVQKRQKKVVAKAERTNKIISDLFPGIVRDRLLLEEFNNSTADVAALLSDDDDMNEDLNSIPKNSMRSGRTLHSHERGHFKTEPGFKGNKPIDFTAPYETKPIADLFPHATVMFADLVGFTAWSSVREPKQVFTLLETLYFSFDTIAKRRRVFKVETVGDCYVAVCGLPDPNPNHATVMARFARDCLKRMRSLTHKLETTLGPDTGDLSMRVGLHSGPVTAGVLRGDKSRFQLFGDTVNTAARIETTGQRNRIHVSMETAELLRNAGKGHWVKERSDIVSAKGKGDMQTAWVEFDGAEDTNNEKAEDEVVNDVSEHESSLDEEEPEDEFNKFELKDLGLDSNEFDVRTQRLVSWNAELLLKLLKQIVARRKAVRARSKEIGEGLDDNDPALWPKTGTNPIEEVKEIIHLPEFDAFVAKHEPDPETIEIDQEVVSQLNDFVRILASMYRSNPFHNFEHASHVAMSVSKLLSRIVAPAALGLSGLDESRHVGDKSYKKNIASTLHDHTYGITSDPLTQFSCVLAALIHDVDHAGIPNTQLIKEKAYIARVYDNKSVAEQNSVDAAWDLLMDVNFRKLRKTICVTLDEQQRFRQLVVNSVMATDIVDKELKALRNARWERAFSDVSDSESERDRVNRKATIVIEHLIQASDVAHTMQHWHIYRKWNERLFHEMLVAYRTGRSETDPAENWYKGEIGFFDFYIIPLAKKLKNCGVFGVSCDEYLNYAQKNRKQWEHKGQEIVANMVQQYQQEYGNTMVQLDGIQDADGSALRSQLLSNETDHVTSCARSRGESLDFDNMSTDTGESFAFSTAKSACSKSLDGSTTTIFEDIKEEESDEDESSEGSESSGSDDSFSNEDEEVNSVHKDVKAQAVSGRDGSSADNASTTTMGNKALDSKVESNVVHTQAQGSLSPSEKSKMAPFKFKTPDHLLAKFGKTSPSSVSDKSSKTPSKSVSTGQSDTTCSATQAVTEWDQESVDSFYKQENEDPMDVDIYCLHQRITKRLVGSITNSRAYDAKPSYKDMSFL